MSILVLLCLVVLLQQPQLDLALLAQEPVLVQALVLVQAQALAQVQLEREPALELPLVLVLARALELALSHLSQVSEPRLTLVRLFLVYHRDPRCSNSLATVWACRVSLVSLRSLALLRWAQQE